MYKTDTLISKSTQTRWMCGSRVITGRRDRISDLKVGHGTVFHLLHSQQHKTRHNVPPFTPPLQQARASLRTHRLQRPSIPLQRARFSLNRAHLHSWTQPIIYKVIVLAVWTRTWFNVFGYGGVKRATWAESQRCLSVLFLNRTANMRFILVLSYMLIHYKK